ncbi:hypothetical protein HOE04_05285 [archaeon]|jgi:hypothetical protein|nr:hypothetical protein [archaeon]
MLQRFCEKLAVRNHRRKIRNYFKELERNIGSYGCKGNVEWLERRKEDRIEWIEENSCLVNSVADEYEGLAHLSFQLGNLFDSMKFFAAAGKSLPILEGNSYYSKSQRKIYRNNSRAIRQKLSDRNFQLI